MSTSTISAITTAVGPAAVGIVRVSGPEALRIAREIFVPAAKKSLADFPPRTLAFGHVRDGAVDVDEVLTVYMPAPHSYTAEDVVEIQCHGGAVSLQKILALTYQHGAEPAAPGEFTKRAFLNGRLDLVQAEAVMDIINARSEVALKNSLRLQEGYLSRELEKIRQELLAVIVNLEAVIDYPEEDIEDVTYARLEQSINRARAAGGNFSVPGRDRPDFAGRFAHGDRGPAQRGQIQFAEPAFERRPGPGKPVCRYDQGRDRGTTGCGRDSFGAGRYGGHPQDGRFCGTARYQAQPGTFSQGGTGHRGYRRYGSFDGSRRGNLDGGAGETLRVNRKQSRPGAE
jgi:hypothetical protein